MFECRYENDLVPESRMASDDGWKTVRYVKYTVHHFILEKQKNKDHGMDDATWSHFVQNDGYSSLYYETRL